MSPLFFKFNNIIEVSGIHTNTVSINSNAIVFANNVGCITMSNCKFCLAYTSMVKNYVRYLDLFWYIIKNQPLLTQKLMY